LSTATAATLEFEGQKVERLKVVPGGGSRPLYSDLWNGATRELIGAGVQSPGTTSAIIVPVVDDVGE
jgi:hypothetical protein